jgi:hypothetical protein
MAARQLGLALLLALCGVLVAPRAFGQGSPTSSLAALIEDAPCGIVRIPAGTYELAATVVKQRCVTLQGAGMGTRIIFDGTGPAIIAGDDGSPTQYSTGGVRDLTLVGPGASSATVGIWFGGDPAGGGLGAAGLGDSQSIVDVRVRDFGVGVEWGSNAWVDTLERCRVFSNGVGITAAPGAANSAEDNRVIATDVFNNAGAGVAAASAADLVFVTSSFDYNGAAAIVDTNAECFGCHFEGSEAPLIDDSQGGSVRLFGGFAEVGASGGAAPGMLVVGPGSAQVLVDGLASYAGADLGALLSGSTGSPATAIGTVGGGGIAALASAGLGSVAGAGNSGFGADPAAVLEGGQLRLAGSIQPLRTTDHTGVGVLVMANGPVIDSPVLSNASFGGGRPVPRMIFAGQQLRMPPIQPGSCYSAVLSAPGSAPGDVAFASPLRQPAGEVPGGGWGMTWSATVQVAGAVTVVACNPTRQFDSATAYFWSAWVIGGYPPGWAFQTLRAPRPTGRPGAPSSGALPGTARDGPAACRSVLLSISPELRGSVPGPGGRRGRTRRCRGPRPRT